MKRVLITGASGFLAWELIHQLREAGGWEIFAASAHPSALAEDPNYTGVTLVSNDRLLSDGSCLERVDCLIHTAFCRKSQGRLLVDSISFGRDLFRLARDHKVGGVINLSSQSVYGSQKAVLPDESGVRDPGYLYALGKAASELLLETVMTEPGAGTSWTNVRLAALLGKSKTVPNNVLYKFVQAGMAGRNLTIEGGQQNFFFLDVRDAAEGIRGLMNLDPKSWARAYNLGPEEQTNIVDMGHSVARYVKENYGKEIQVCVVEGNVPLNAGMDCRMLYRTLGWKPKYSVQDMIAAAAEDIERQQ